MSISYIEKFNALSKEIKDKVNAPEAVARINALEQEYAIQLAPIIMKVMVFDIKLDAIAAYLINEAGMAGDKAAELERKLRRGVFAEVIDYLLGAAKGPKLVFDDADERDAKRVSQPLANDDFDKLIETTVENIVSQSRVNFSDPLGAGKFRQVIKTYLRGTRDKFATNEALTKASELGGVALSRDTADRIILLTDSFLPALAKAQPSAAPAPAIPVPEDKPLPSTRDIDYNLEASLKEQGKLKTPAAEKPKPILDPEHELMPPPPVVVPITKKTVVPEITKDQSTPQTVPITGVPVPDSAKGRLQVLKNLIAGKPLDKPGLRQLTETPPVVSAAAVPSSAPQTPPAKQIENRPKSPTGKIKMDDIHFNARVESPVDEIGNMTLKNFRRLDPDPIKAADKIKQRMELLGREDYAKKIAAIAAWHQSPLNRLYLEVGRRSLEENLSVKDILEREIKSQPDFLKPTELEAIINLNRTIKF